MISIVTLGDVMVPAELLGLRDIPPGHTLSGQAILIADEMGQILGGGRLVEDVIKTEMAVLECWAVSDMKHKHWRRALDTGAVGLLVAESVNSSVRLTLMRFQASTKHSLDRAASRREGVLDTVKTMGVMMLEKP